MTKYYETVTETLAAWVEGFAAALPNIVAALVVVALFFLFARPIATLVSRAVGRVSDSDVIAGLSESLSRYGVVIVGLFVALGIVGLDKTVTSLLAGVGVIGIALGFAFQDIAANFVAGVLMGVRRPFSIGDVVETNGFTGVVADINLRATVLETFSGQRVIVPNKEVFTNPMINFNGTGARRVEVLVGISYDDDIEKAVGLARRAIEKFDFLAPGKNVEVIADSFGASSIDLKVRYWIPFPGDKPYPAALHDGIVAIKKAFDGEGIEIPFPIRTLDFSGVDGDVLAALTGRGRETETPSQSSREYAARSDA